MSVEPQTLAPAIESTPAASPVSFRNQNTSGDSATDCDTPPDREECNFIENIKEEKGFKIDIFAKSISYQDIAPVVRNTIQKESNGKQEEKSHQIPHNMLAFHRDTYGSSFLAQELPATREDENKNIIFPRRKRGQGRKQGHNKEGVIVTMEVLEQVFHLPLHKACKTLGICATAFKKVCRKLGVMKWPYKEQQTNKNQGFSAAQFGTNTAVDGMQDDYLLKTGQSSLKRAPKAIHPVKSIHYPSNQTLGQPSEKNVSTLPEDLDPIGFLAEEEESLLSLMGPHDVSSVESDCGITEEVDGFLSGSEPKSEWDADVSGEDLDSWTSFSDVLKVQQTTMQ